MNSVSIHNFRIGDSSDGIRFTMKKKSIDSGSSSRSYVTFELHKDVSKERDQMRKIIYH